MLVGRKTEGMSRLCAHLLELAPHQSHDCRRSYSSIQKRTKLMANICVLDDSESANLRTETNKRAISVDILQMDGQIKVRAVAVPQRALITVNAVSHELLLLRFLSRVVELTRLHREWLKTIRLPELQVNQAISVNS
jgi:hypothetical protein